MRTIKRRNWDRRCEEVNEKLVKAGPADKKREQTTN